MSEQPMSLERALGLFDLVLDARRTGQPLSEELCQALEGLEGDPAGQAELRMHEHLARTVLTDLARTELRDLSPDESAQEEGE